MSYSLNPGEILRRVLAVMTKAKFVLLRTLFSLHPKHTRGILCLERLFCCSQNNSVEALNIQREGE